MDDFSIAPDTPNAFGLVGNAQNAIAPGKRPLSSMSPTIVLEGEAVKMVVGGAGGPTIISGTLQVLLNVLDGSWTPRRPAPPPASTTSGSPRRWRSSRTSPATWSRAWSAAATRSTTREHVWRSST